MNQQPNESFTPTLKTSWVRMRPVFHSSVLDNYSAGTADSGRNLCDRYHTRVWHHYLGAPCRSRR